MSSFAGSRARPDGPPELTFTPLMMAVASGQTQSVERLLERGADPRRTAPDGVTLLTLAVSGGALTDIDEPLLGACHTDTVKLLSTVALGGRSGRAPVPAAPPGGGGCCGGGSIASWKISTRG